jgi:hypothetical protein
MTRRDEIPHDRSQQGPAKDNADDGRHGNCALFGVPDVDQAAAKEGDGSYAGDSAEESSDEDRGEGLSDGDGDAKDCEEGHAGEHGISSSEMFRERAPEGRADRIALI